MKPSRDPNPTVRRAQRVLRMAHELHKLGYQRLRISPGMSPSGMYWRCDITPASNILVSHGAMAIHFDEQRIAGYSTGQENEYFDWTDAKRNTARELAAKFLERFPDLAREGRGRDWAYAGWYVEMLGMAEQGIFPIAYADYDIPQDPEWLYTSRGLGFLPMPPGGEGKPKGEAEQHDLKPRSRYPLTFKSLDHPDNPPAALLSDSLIFWKLAEKFLTPEEIHQAAEQGKKRLAEARQKKAAFESGGLGDKPSS